MLNPVKFVGIAAVTFACLHLSGCGNIQTVKSFSTPYEQPTSGERAKIRIISFDGMVRAVPNSSCIDWRLPGAGVMVVSAKRFANVNDQTLDMPVGKFPGLVTSMGSVAVSELYIPAGKPIALHYLSQGDMHKTIYQGSRQVGTSYVQCFVPRSFVPVAGENYEAVYKQIGDLCQFSIVRLAENGGIDSSSQVILNEAPLCRKSDIF